LPSKSLPAASMLLMAVTVDDQASTAEHRGGHLPRLIHIRHGHPGTDQQPIEGECRGLVMQVVRKAACISASLRLYVFSHLADVQQVADYCNTRDQNDSVLRYFLHP
jgi:hypothetical protein